MIIDSHMHLDNYHNEDIKRVIEEINNYKIFTLNVSMNLEGYLKSKQIAGDNNYIVNCMGIHPWEAYKYCDKLNSLDKYIDESPAIGEVGLDLFWIKDKSLFSKQRKVLNYFLEKASIQEKVVNLHTKGAEKEILDKIIEYRLINPIIHWYSGPEKLINKYIEAGAYFTVSVEVMYSEKIKSVLKRIPNDRLLLETDNPGGSLWLTNKTGYPSLIHDVAEAVAKFKNVKKSKIIESNLENFKRVFFSSNTILDKINSVNFK